MYSTTEKNTSLMFISLLLIFTDGYIFLFIQHNVSR